MDPSRANQSMDDSSSSYGDSIFSSRSPSSSNTSIIPPGPPRGDEIDRWQRHIGMQDFAKDLQIAAESVYPNHKRSRYSNVYVLIFKWKTEDPKLPVWYEIEELYHVLDQIYGYEIEIFEIPDHKSHAKVVEKVTAFIAINDDSKNDLKIVYYAGHSRLSDTRDLVWSSWENSIHCKCPTVTYTGIQHSLEQAESDVLILLDSCSSGIGDGGEGYGVTELMAACAFDTIANGVGHYSFTKALTTELRLLSKKRDFPVVELYTKVYCRAQHHMPQGIKNERYPAPIHLLLTRDDTFPRSIQLSVQKRSSAQTQIQGPGTLEDRSSTTKQAINKRRRDHDVDTLSNKRPCLSSKEDIPKDSMDFAPEHPETSQTAVQLFQEDLGEPSTVLFPLNTAMETINPISAGLQSTVSQRPRDAPRLLFSVRLEENVKAEDLSVEYFADWLRMIPTIAEEVTVEGVFKSDSTLLLLALPFFIWPYLTPHPAVINLGPIRSPNTLNILIPEGQNHWSTDDDGGVDSLPPSHLTDEMASPSLTSNAYQEKWFSKEDQQHPAFKDQISTNKNVPSSATLWALLGHSSKEAVDFDTMDHDNELGLWKKNVEACWRCKFLQNSFKCNVQNPCSTCPPSGTASCWAAIGCRRGSLISHMHPIGLCPRIQPERLGQNILWNHGEDTSTSENVILKKLTEKRTTMLTSRLRSWIDANSVEISNNKLQLLDLWFNSTYPKIQRVTNPALAQVNSCLLNIIWEVMGSTSIKSLLHDVYPFDDLPFSLSYAAQYQVSLATDQLISKSLICLCGVLEAMVVETQVTKISHQSCNSTSCSVNCIASLNNGITSYLEELSEAFLLKENLRNEERLWLSIFYSLCIQGIVRRVLIELVKAPTADLSEHTGIKEYLYLPLQLFIGISGSYDPLVDGLNSGRNSAAEKDSAQAIVSARKAVGQEMWKVKCISGSGDYLKRLFGLDESGSGMKMDASKGKVRGEADTG